MDWKKVAMLGTALVVVLFCVVGAGCTSTDDINQKIVGTWTTSVDYKDLSYSTEITFNNAGSGKEVQTFNDGIQKEYPFVWHNDGPTANYGVIYTLTLSYESGLYVFEYNSTTDTMEDELGFVYTRK